MIVLARQGDEPSEFEPLKFKPTAYIFDIKQCLVVPYINPANMPLGSKLATPLVPLSSIDYKWKIKL